MSNISIGFILEQGLLVSIVPFFKLNAYKQQLFYLPHHSPLMLDILVQIARPLNLWFYEAEI